MVLKLSPPLAIDTKLIVCIMDSMNSLKKQILEYVKNKYQLNKTQENECTKYSNATSGQ